MIGFTSGRLPTLPVNLALIKGFSGSSSPQAAVAEMVDTIDTMLATPDPEA